MRAHVGRLGLVVLILVIGAGAAEAFDADRTKAPYLETSGELVIERLPLEETTADVTVAGVIAHVRLRQVFRNDGAKPIEAVYVFGASTRAAIHDMRLRIGARTIEARIEKRAAAREQYQAARQQGRSAALLEQQRANVFTTRVANVMPQARIEVELEYSEMIVPEENVYELVVPGPVGPRYPGGGADPASEPWLSNPYLQNGETNRTKYDVKVRLETGLALKDVSSPSHAIDVSWTSNAVADVRLARPGGNDKDFILRFRLAGDRIEAGALAWRGEKEGFFAVIVEPPASPRREQIAPREYVFVVDVSGSMSGFPLETAKVLMRDLLTRLRPTDALNVVVFAGGSARLSPRSIAATPANIEQAIRFVDAQHGGGGTELVAALETAYAIPRLGAHVARSVVLVTDGFVAVEPKAFRFVREHLDSANLFAFGIGTSVNRGLIEGLARAGAGEPWVVTSEAEAGPIAERFRRAVEEPVLTGIALSFRGVGAREVVPMKVPDLMARRPLVVFGKLTGKAQGEVEVSGWSGGGRWSQVVPLGTAGSGDRLRSLRWLWARKWGELLQDEHHLSEAVEVENAIADVGLAYRLVTPFTSFVAIDSHVANSSGEIMTVSQPLPVPEGVSSGTSFGLSGSAGGGGYGSKMSLGGTIGVGAIGTKGRGGGSGVWGTGVSLRGAFPDGKTRVKGSLKEPIVRDVVRRSNAQVRYCYEIALQNAPQLRGKLTVRWTISPTGSVSGAWISGSSVGNRDLEACVTGRVRTWAFPRPSNGGTAIVTQTWSFKPPSK